MGGEGRKTVSVGHWFSSIFDNSREKNGQALSGTFAPRLYNSYNSMSQASTCVRVRALGPAPSAPKQWKSDVHVRSKTLSARDRHWRNSRKKKLQRVQHCNSKTKARVSRCQCTDELSAMQNGLWVATSFSNLRDSNPCHLTTATCLNH